MIITSGYQWPKWPVEADNGWASCAAQGSLLRTAASACARTTLPRAGGRLVMRSAHLLQTACVITMGKQTTLAPARSSCPLPGCQHLAGQRVAAIPLAQEDSMRSKTLMLIGGALLALFVLASVASASLGRTVPPQDPWFTLTPPPAGQLSLERPGVTCPCFSTACPRFRRRLRRRRPCCTRPPPRPHPPTARTCW